MRFAFVPFVVAVSFTLAAAQTATINRPADYFRIDVTRLALPVYVLNFPEVQTVSGTVSVDNLPAVQTVGGTVNVGNLPLDDDGALRVAGAPARQMVWYELLTEPLVIDAASTVLLPNPVSVDGFEHVGVRVVRSGGVTLEVRIDSQWSPDEGFSPVQDSRVGGLCAGAIEYRLVCPATGGNARVSLRNYQGAPSTISSVRVYLFP